MPRPLYPQGRIPVHSVPQPVWTFQSREKSHGSTGVGNPYLAACSTVTIAHSVTQTSNQHTLHSPACIMYCTVCAVMPTVLGGTCSSFQLNLCRGLYLEVFVSSAHPCTKQHYIITVISFTYQKVDKGTYRQVMAFVNLLAPEFYILNFSTPSM
jgi:hypothetical protein